MRLLDHLDPDNVFEVGLMQGGSTALIMQLAEPRKLCAIELCEDPLPGLEGFAARHGLERALSIHTGVDQADQARVRSIAATEFDDSPLDLVIDDASHQLHETRVTFETLFPLLRPGGEYLVEDWAWAHAPFPLWPKRVPLTPLIFELTIACGSSPHVIGELEVSQGWVLVRRGPAPIETDAFALADLYGARGRAMVEAAERAPAPGLGPERTTGSRIRDRLGSWRRKLGSGRGARI